MHDSWSEIPHDYLSMQDVTHVEENPHERTTEYY